MKKDIWDFLVRFAGAAEGELNMRRDTRISTAGGANLDVYGGDMALADATALLNASEATLSISERCSATDSMAIGGTTTPTAGGPYALNLVAAVLITLLALPLMKLM